ncbi:queuine tRNA-ribosyltransferase [uncultured archaeon]|nr:queuine tRNA-ribosyltransferase [uncultured archaeon]
MIKDEAFFGFARTGELNGFQYPGIMRSGKGGQIVATGTEIEVLGEKIQRRIFYPDAIESSGSDRFLTLENLVLIPNGIELLQRPAKLIERIHQVRKSLGFGKLIYVQGISDPYLIPALVYAGVQLFDDSYPVAEGLEGIKYTMFGKSKSDQNTVEENTSFIEAESALLRKSIENGTLREIVEKFAFSSKALEIMRILDRYYYAEMEAVYPVRTPYIKANGIEALERPDLKRYREKLSSEFKKPDDVRIALIMPCSARKPYSTSKSHQAILSRISDFRRYIHEIIVTSPVGVVPRELEDSYPARFYDIPVIGMWYEEEKKMMSDLLLQYFKRNTYDKVIAFIPEDLNFIIPSLPAGSEVISGGASVTGNLSKLKSALKESVSLYGKEKPSDRRLETYRSIAAFQFGNWIRDYLSGAKIINSYNQDMLTLKGNILLVYNRELGKFTINKRSAEFFLEQGRYLVEIDNFKPTANVYAVGVLDCTSDVRPEDEVVLTHKGEIKGVGIAKMPPDAMKQLKKGTAVKVRN